MSALSEFEIIEKYFAQQVNRRDVIVGIGDDCSIVEVPPANVLAISTDTLVAGQHFPLNTEAKAIGYKALAVNLSDLAAQGATPAWATLALTMPEAKEAWIEDFCRGFFTLLNQYNMQLIGGDLTRGSLTITVQVHGFLPRKKGLLRSGAQPNDGIYVTGTLGDAALALQCLQEKISIPGKSLPPLLEKLEYPKPCIAEGGILLDIASAAIDISDGLAADLQHILDQSGVGARIELNQLPLSDETSNLDPETAWRLALSGGDDYELCFTVPAHKLETLESIFAANKLKRITRIGTIEKNSGLRILHSNGELLNLDHKGFLQF